MTNYRLLYHERQPMTQADFSIWLGKVFGMDKAIAAKIIPAGEGWSAYLPNNFCWCGGHENGHQVRKGCKGFVQGIGNPGGKRT